MVEKSSPLPGAYSTVTLPASVHQFSSFNHIKIPKDQIWNLIKEMPLSLGFFLAGQGKGTGFDELKH